MPQKAVLDPKTVEWMRTARWKARTDLGYLCREILGYQDVDDYVHGPMLRMLQKFPKPTKSQFTENDYFDGRIWRYKPIQPSLQALEGGRKRLILVARSHLKTYVNAQAHTIQWILNYPDIKMAIFQSNLEKAELILKAIKDQFKYNPRFRQLFPEHVPPANKADDFGVTNSFTTMARDRGKAEREPTVIALSIDKGTAGMHFDIIKYSDIVEPENTKTPERIESVKKSFSLAHSLLTTPNHWEDVEGTIYHPNDLYCDLIKRWHEDKSEGKNPYWDVIVQAVYKCRDPKTGLEQTSFGPDTLTWPFMKDEDQKYIPWWQRDTKGPRFTYEGLEEERREDAFVFACQKLLRPDQGQLISVFPMDKFMYIPTDTFRRKISVVHRTVTIDTAETVGPRSNHSVITVCAWDLNNTCWVEKIYRGKWELDQLISRIFEVYSRHKPSAVRMEETGYVRGLKSGLLQKMQNLGLYIPFEFVKPDNQKSKMERIRLTLQPIYATGKIRFVAPWNEGKELDSCAPVEQETWRALLDELKGYPIPPSDDILDTLADQFQDKEWLGRLVSRGETSEEKAALAAYREAQVMNYYGFTLSDGPDLPECEAYYN